MTRAVDVLEARSKKVNIVAQILAIAVIVFGAVWGSGRFYSDLQDVKATVGTLKAAAQSPEKDQQIALLNTRVTKLEDAQINQKDSLDKLAHALEDNTRTLNTLVESTSKLAGKFEMMQSQQAAKR